jgi:hypothetical protein
MSANEKLFDDKFWNILVTLDGLNQDVSVSELCHHFGPQVEEKDILEVISFMRKFHYPLSAQKREGLNWICLQGKKPRVSMDLSFSEWLALQAQFPLFEETKNRSLFETLSHKLKLVEAAHPDQDLYRVMEEEREFQHFRSEMSEDKEFLLRLLGESISQGAVITIEAENNNYIKAYPHKVVFLDGVLSLIAEDVNDRCMICMEFSDMLGITPKFEHNYKVNFVSAEVDDFIMAIRSITGNEERLVLRISSPEKVNLKPQYHFLGSPYVTTNTEGEFIWAASVEVSSELFRWLDSIKEEIEILDPQEVKEEFENFLVSESANRPLKKAS